MSFAPLEIGASRAVLREPIESKILVRDLGLDVSGQNFLLLGIITCLIDGGFINMAVGLFKVLNLRMNVLGSDRAQPRRCPNDAKNCVE